MLDFIRKVHGRIAVRNARSVKYTKDQTIEYINSFSEPIDDIERSYFQYCCQRRETGVLFNIMEDLVSIILYFPYYLHYRNMVKKLTNKIEYPFIATGKMIMQSIPEEYSENCFVPDFYRGILTKKDKALLNTISKRYPLAPFFCFKIMCRIANYSYIIKKYSPKIIFCSAEYSFTSSILTMYCEERGVKLNNAMHGEKRFDAREAFSRFSKFYVWDEFYKNLFLSLRAVKTEYVIRALKVPQLENKENDNYTYYLQAQTLKQLKIIKMKLEAMNVNYKVRQHPLYFSRDFRRIFDEKHVESNEIDIWDSIKNAGHVVSVDSTVNYQAYLVGVKVILDDVSDPDYFNKLSEQDYIMLQKPHQLLSEL